MTNFLPIPNRDSIQTQRFRCGLPRRGFARKNSPFLCRVFPLRRACGGRDAGQAICKRPFARATLNRACAIPNSPKYRLHPIESVVSLRRFCRGGLVAQSVEQCPFKALVQGSSPCQPTTFQRQKAKGKRQKAEGRRQKEEGRRKKAKGRRQKQKAEGKRQDAPGWATMFRGGLPCRGLRIIVNTLCRPCVQRLTV